MQHSSLTSFLNGERQGDDLWREIEGEVEACLEACAKRGAGHVFITDGPETNITRKEISVLLTALAEAKLPLSAASYIADALIMSDDFEWNDNAVAEALFFLSDESAPLTLRDVKEAQSRLATAL